MKAPRCRAWPSGSAASLWPTTGANSWEGAVRRGRQSAGKESAKDWTCCPTVRDALHKSNSSAERLRAKMDQGFEMKIWMISDLHLEYADLRQPLRIPDADVCVVAGDLCRGPANGAYWLGKHVAHAMPCVYVAGNHEFYAGGIHEGLEDGRAAANHFEQVHFLENDSVIIQGVRFIGATLWTDYKIEGSRELAMLYARERMNDYKKIAARRNPWQRFLPRDAYRMHQESRSYIEAALKFDSIKTVVVTHHLPHASSIPARFKGDLLNAAY
ncbi:MAG: hypothetical protein E5W55_21255, partial [Mesorhizobium sp.]